MAKLSFSSPTRRTETPDDHRADNLIGGKVEAPAKIGSNGCADAVEIVLTPAELEARLPIKPDWLAKVIEEAKRTRVSICYTYHDTAFGRFPLRATLLDQRTPEEARADREAGPKFRYAHASLVPSAKESALWVVISVAAPKVGGMIEKLATRFTVGVPAPMSDLEEGDVCHLDRNGNMTKVGKLG